MENIFGKKSPSHFHQKLIKKWDTFAILGNPSYDTTNNGWIDFISISSKI